MMTLGKQRWQFSLNHPYDKHFIANFLAFSTIESQLFLCKSQSHFSPYTISHYSLASL